MDVAPEFQRKRERSPNYPGIGLERAIERAGQIMQSEGRNAAPPDAILHDWGYAPKSGLGMVHLAALKQFGLITEEGRGDQRRSRLSDLALTILLDDREESAERQEALRTAALTPAVHATILERYPSLPSDATLRLFLVKELRFTQSAVAELIEELKETLAFAEITGTDKVASSRPDVGGVPSDSSHRVSPASNREPEAPIAQPGQAPTPRRGGMSQDTGLTTIPLPLVGGTESVVIEGQFPLSETAWTQLIAMLTALKPGLVRSDAFKPIEWATDPMQIPLKDVSEDEGELQ